MKTRYATTTALLLALTIAVPAFADTSVSADSQTGLRAELETKKVELQNERENIKNTIKSNIESFRSSTTEDRKDLTDEMKSDKKDIQNIRRDFHVELAQNKLINASKLFDLTINRLNKIIDRVDSRIAKIQGQGGTTTEAEGFVVSAKASITDAQVQITAINSFNLMGMSTTTAQTTFQTIKADAAKAHQDLESARQDLFKAIESLMKIEKSIHKGTATTTPVTATTTATTTVSH